LGTRTLGAHHALTLRAHSLFLGTQRRLGRGAKLAETYDTLLPRMRADSTVGPDYFVNALLERANLALDDGRPDVAESLAHEALVRAKTHIGEDKEQTLGAAVLLALIYQRNRKWDLELEAAATVRRLTFDVLKFDDKHPQAMDARVMYGMALADTGRLAEGLEEIARGVAAASTLGDDSGTLAAYRGHLARYQLRAGRLDSAADHYARALATWAKVRGTNAPTYLTGASMLGAIQLAARRPEAALPHLRHAVEGYRGAAHERSQITTALLAQALSRIGQTAEADKVLSAATAPAPGTLASGEHMLAQALSHRLAGRLDAALKTSSDAYASVVDAIDTRTVRARLLMERGVNELETGRADAATTSFTAAAEILRSVQLETTPDLADAWVGLARARLQANEPAAALPLLEEADALWRRFDPSNRAAAETAYWLGSCHAALGNSGLARAAYRRAGRVLANSPLSGERQLAAVASRY